MGKQQPNKERDKCVLVQETEGFGKNKRWQPGGLKDGCLEEHVLQDVIVSPSPVIWLCCSEPQLNSGLRRHPQTSLCGWHGFASFSSHILPVGFVRITLIRVCLSLGKSHQLWAQLVDSRVVWMCQNFVIAFSIHSCAIMVPGGVLSGGSDLLCGFLPSQNLKALHVIVKAHSLPVLCIPAVRAGLWVLPAWLPVPAGVPADCFHPGMSQAAQALSPFDPEHKMLSAALLSSFLPVILCSPHCTLWHLRLDILQSACHPSELLKPMAVKSSACLQVDMENVPCVTLCSCLALLIQPESIFKFPWSGTSPRKCKLVQPDPQHVLEVLSCALVFILTPSGVFSFWEALNFWEKL